jgi:hypothetical protein
MNMLDDALSVLCFSCCCYCCCITATAAAALQLLQLLLLLLLVCHCSSAISSTCSSLFIASKLLKPTAVNSDDSSIRGCTPAYSAVTPPSSPIFTKLFATPSFLSSLPVATCAVCNAFEHCVSTDNGHNHKEVIVKSQ